MKHVKTPSGFEADIDESFTDDMEFIEALIAFESRHDGAALPMIVDKVMGDAKPALYAHHRAENGRVSARGVMTDVMHIVRKLTPKNS